MEYTVKDLAALAGVSTRTLRYYDQIGLLTTTRSQNGYRIYHKEAVDRLQLILFYRTLGVRLEEIKRIIDDPEFDALVALENHHTALLEEQDRLAERISNVEKTIRSKKGGTQMSDQEKFEGFKKDRLEENETRYGKEIREQYGEETISRSNEKWMNMTRRDYGEMKALEQKLADVLKEGATSVEPPESLYEQAAVLHREWLMYTWTTYSKDAHRGLAETYVGDERFRKYYDDIAPGAAQFLRDAIVEYMQ
ncbi:MerR family transcriptional regulator [Salinicoccus hispanicus]|uniref:MerR family transcriptional regulator n=1 Tax=Salinicoccus hispanicus TaxID=157225 RepID=A0A6N8TZL7_9STAP|nr:MerR family transcriptional regulator [Salinicoccus hispanicus]MXQ50922.1 MerR family transcriptional regulator [Salinicoccus hispanicus]